MPDVNVDHEKEEGFLKQLFVLVVAGGFALASSAASLVTGRRTRRASTLEPN